MSESSLKPARFSDDFEGMNQMNSDDCLLHQLIELDESKISYYSNYVVKKNTILRMLELKLCQAKNWEILRKKSDPSPECTTQSGTKI